MAFFFLCFLEGVNFAIKELCNLNTSYHVYNLVPELLDYKELIESIREVVDIPYQEFYLSDEELNQYGIFLPYNYYKEQTLKYDGSRVIKDTNISYTPLDEGISKTYKALKSDLIR